MRPHFLLRGTRVLYAELHRWDDAEAEWIVVEKLPESSEWSAIADRLRRASCHGA
ncbi:MAG: hypothetical protein KJ072_28165 [Verrucomicrobia bacterium]|nr:hypothetical protein [Verrucomicrobiota bacterium]